jgi:hypothetical protein
MTLPPLLPEDINKFDILLEFLKQNKIGFINIGQFCFDKWGNNRQLYLSFATHLKINGLTYVQNHDGEEHIWEQMISQRGLMLDSFSNEYKRQNEKEKKEKRDDFIDKTNKKTDFITKPILFITTIVLAAFSIYQSIAVNKYEAKINRQEKYIDSIQKVVESLKQDNINKPPTQMDKIKKVDTSK